MLFRQDDTNQILAQLFGGLIPGEAQVLNFCCYRLVYVIQSAYKMNHVSTLA